MMNEELDYAEMLEIPVETVTVKRKERKKKAEAEPDLTDQLVEQVNDRMEQEDPAYAESRAIERVEKPVSRRAKLMKMLILGEFIAVCVLCAVIFLTNIFMVDSAINTFVRGLFQGETSTADGRMYSDFTLAPVVNDYVETTIEASETGVLSFTAQCSVYAPCEGKLAAVNGDEESGYTVEVRHSDNFSTIMSGLDVVYGGVGDTVRHNVPLGFTDGEGEVRVMFYENGTLINGCVVDGNELSWS